MKRNRITALAIICVGIGNAAAYSDRTDDPTDARVTVPAANYRSPFADYRVLGEDKSQAWKDANDTVRGIGGWRAYAKESAEAANATADKAKPAAPSAPASAPSTPPPATPAPPVATPHKHGG